MKKLFVLALMAVVLWVSRLFAVAGIQHESKTFVLNWRFGSQTRRDSFNISRQDIVSVGSMLSYPSLSEETIDLENRRQGVEVSGEYAIDERWYLDLAISIIDAKVAVPVGSGDNVYSGGNNYPEIVFGINRLIMPQTPVTPAARVGFYTGYAEYNNLSRLETVQPAQVQRVSAVFSETTVVAALEISKCLGRKKIWEPYGSGQFGYRSVRLFDNDSAEVITGRKNLLDLSVGINYYPEGVLDKKFFVEYNLGTTVGWSAGFSFQL